MANFKLSSDDYNSLISPIQSDISLNDGSAFSFGSLGDTPDGDHGFKQLRNRHSDLESNLEAFTKSTSKKPASSFNKPLHADKNESNIEVEKLKAAHEQLEQSMDSMFYNKNVNPVSKNTECQSNCTTDSSSPELKQKFSGEKSGFKDLNINSEKNSDKNYKNKPDELVPKAVKGRKVSPPTKNSLSKDSKLSKNLISSNNKVEVKCPEKVVKTQKAKKPTKAVSSSEKSKSLEVKSLDSVQAVDGKVKNLSQKYNKEKVGSASNQAAKVEKGISLEKSIQISVGMEFDKIRSLMLDQNICLRKEMMKLQDLARKQNEVNGYLLMMIDDLVESNQKLLSKRN